jgi:hypothetical protein
MRHRQVAGMGIDMGKQGRLEVALDLRLSGVDDLEDEGASGRLHFKILVALACERRKRARQPVVLGKQAGCGL